MSLRPLLLIAFLLLSAGCGVIRPGTGAGGRAPTVQLVDSIPWANDFSEGVLRRVEVRSGSRVDTLAGVTTVVLPVVVRDSLVIGFAYEEDAVTRGYSYDVGQRHLAWLTLPDDFNPYFSAPSVSPDGHHIAYVVVPGNSTAWAAVRNWPGGSLVWRSDTVEVPATDASGVTFTRWLSPDSAEAVIATGFSLGDGWYRVLGSVRRAAVVEADSVRQFPIEVRRQVP